MATARVAMLTRLLLREIVAMLTRLARLENLPDRSPAHAVKQAFDGLTGREREVARLVAQGKSNRALADELVVSERTVEKRVERIMFKLGFSSRAQSAAWAVEKGLVVHNNKER